MELKECFIRVPPSWILKPLWYAVLTPSYVKGYILDTLLLRGLDPIQIRFYRGLVAPQHVRKAMNVTKPHLLKVRVRVRVRFRWLQRIQEEISFGSR